jgi:hypothetical protein
MNPSVSGAERDQPESEGNRITLNLKEKINDLSFFLSFFSLYNYQKNVKK